MRAIVLAVVAAIILTSAPVKADPRVDPAGFGQVRVGMTPAQAATALGNRYAQMVRKPADKVATTYRQQMVRKASNLWSKMAL
jgi:hypothetical protein